MRSAPNATDIKAPNKKFDPEHFSVRELQPGDSVGLWKIRNLKEVRMLSNNTEVISKNRHDAWFAKYIANPENHCYVLDFRGRVAGYCRIDAGLISIAIDPTYHGIGLGTKLLREAVNRVQPHVKKIAAEIHFGNEVSLKLFTNIGFKIVRTIPGKYILEYHAP